MKNLNIPVGISDFERIRELNYYYVDKTGLIKTLLQGEMDQVTVWKNDGDEYVEQFFGYQER